MTTISLKRTSSKMTGLALPIAIAALAATAAYAGADTTFTPALTKFTFLVAGGSVGDDINRGDRASTLG